MIKLWGIDLLEGLKGFGLALSEKPKLVGRHKGEWHWDSKRKSKIQPKSPKIRVASPEVVLVPTASSKVALLPTIASEEAR